MWRAEGKWLPKTSRKLQWLHNDLKTDMPRMPSSELLIKLLKRTVSKTESPELATKDPPSDDHGNSNGSHVKIFLPKKLLECLPKCSSLPKERHRWNTNEEIAAYLITFEKHEEWLTTSPKTRPQNGSMILYNRKKVKYRKDGYCWKKRKDGKTTREDHMKLKVQGVECLYGCYVHSSIIPTFHRRCYWLLQVGGWLFPPVFGAWKVSGFRKPIEIKWMGSFVEGCQMRML
ncbi:calmodulin-binding transcription activator 1-like isoform X1 [Macrotis lagotis]|uniref:calmodulin-binding transcription activator 1-like isoform X1 n=1 Tax=Macrotis lagotis TaxID=92651 RepID=UPI003D6899D3